MQQPPHPPDQLTTFELSRYRRELEHALKVLPDHATVRALLRAKLTDVLAEQESRSQAAKAPSGHDLI
jgi:hypothetical protein